MSCLMVTHDRVRLARQAIRSFADQTWPRRELVIVTDGPRHCRRALETYVGESRISCVRFLHPDRADLPLAALRNLALDAARGDVLCQWDDDDCSHPERLAIQLDTMQQCGARASFFTDHLQLLERERLVSWIDWTSNGRVTGQNQLAPGTLMMMRDDRFRYPETGPYVRQGEDSVLLSRLYREIPVAPLRGAGHLYLYRYHGRNTFPEAHHVRMSRFGLPRQALIERRAIVCAALAYYGVSRPSSVVGPDGPAFTFE